MDVEVSFLAVALAAISAMVIGFVWYSKSFFGKEWMKLNKIKEDEKMKKEAPKAMVKMLIGAFLTAYLLSHFIAFAVAFYPDRSEVSVGLTTAFFVWLGFMFAQSFGSDAFEQRPFKLTLINTANQLITLLTMGFIIGALTY